MKQLSIRTNSRSEMIDITRAVESVVEEANVRNGICYVFVPHTTAAVTINENADPDVPRDIIMELEKVIPYQDNYRHREGNSAAHVKASLIGSSETVLVEGGRLLLGTWQSLFFCEFDGPRTRKYVVKVVATGSETENRKS
ncbi:MAG: YjbQ family protein [Deltaproteobacteria bacterium]|nr:YjbQ family protein [Deltaproteobacteria bacterium]MBN2687351.1 YjbQ family protein [Deltaproteobacteria bacterium]